MGKNGGYYAVAHGRQTGIFTTWNEAEAQVKGFPGARYKKFGTEGEANAFIQMNSSTSAKASINNKRQRSDDHDVSVYPNEKRMHCSIETFYVVAKGHSTGIFTTWSDVCKETEGFPHPLYRKFDSLEAAQGFLSGYNVKEQERSMKERVLSPSSSKSPHKYWYAVAKGRQTGVFETWNEAKPNVENIYSAKYKKFSTREEAEAFVKQYMEATKEQTIGKSDPKDPSTLVAFCDGSALQNGRFGCQAGYACIFPHNTTWNVAKKLIEPRATNNRAEYMAAIEAMKRANMEDSSGIQPLYIYSDSMLLIKSMTEWIGGWQKKNWVKADGNPVLNRDLLEQLLKVKGARTIFWEHVKAHTGRTDWKSKWNDVADVAARNAAMS